MSTRRKATIIIVAIVGGMLLLPVGFHFYLRWDCARHRAELARKGEKLKVQEVAPAPLLPDQNGALLLQGIIGQLPLQPTNLFPSEPRMMIRVASGRALVHSQQPDLLQANSETNTPWAELRQQMEPYLPAIEELHAALQKPAFDYRLNYAQGMSLPLPHLGRTRTFALTLKSAAGLHLHEQNLPAAFRDLKSLIAMMNVLEKEPLHISQMVRNAHKSIALSATWEALQADGWTDAQLAELQQRWAAQRFMEPFLAALQMERAMALHDMDRARSSYSFYIKAFTPFITRDGSYNFLEQLTDQLQIWTWPVYGSFPTERTCLDIGQIAIDALREAMTNAPYQTVRTNMNSALAALGVQGDPLGPERQISSPGRSSIDRVLTDGVARLLVAITRPFSSETEARLVITAIAVKRYQLRHGKLPRDLSALTPKFLATVPIDPMSGQSLRYRPETNAMFLLYSLGTDGEDNGGDATPLKESGPKDWLSGRDWVWPQPASAEEIEQYGLRQSEEARKKAERRQGRRKAPKP